MRTLTRDTPKHVGETVKIQGWVVTRRDHGKIIFVDIRDMSGIVQVVGSAPLESLRPGDVVEIHGTLTARPATFVNPKLPTGTVEVHAATATTIAHAKEFPFPTDTDGHDIDEDIRLKYRYLDLRRPRMRRNLRIRHEVNQFIRAYLTARDFIEIETPILSKTTPEGARDFLVPSRLQPGKFYALPQSPQQYKQLLMVAGFERYFQIARVFRDEDPRSDRAYGEFTQLDLEMAFVTQKDILSLTETLFTELVRKIFPKKKILQSPWPRLTQKDAIKKFGTDKPDLRKKGAGSDELAFAWILDFPLFTKQTKEEYYHGTGETYAPSHHMFTAPHPDDIPRLSTNPLAVRGLQHDLVLNGVEIGGGSMRIHDPKVQEKVFALIGFTPAQKKQFGHLLTAFTYGVPPHGGIAPGIDRFLMMVLGEPNVREVIAFPMSSSGQTAVMDAPSSATAQQLREISIRV